MSERRYLPHACGLLSVLAAILLALTSFVASSTSAGSVRLSDHELSSARGASDWLRTQSTPYACSEVYGNAVNGIGGNDCVWDSSSNVECGICDYEPYSRDGITQGTEHVSTGTVDCQGARAIGICSYDPVVGEYYCDGSNATNDGTCGGTVPITNPQ